MEGPNLVQKGSQSIICMRVDTGEKWNVGSARTSTSSSKIEDPQPGSLRALDSTRKNKTTLTKTQYIDSLLWNRILITLALKTATRQNGAFRNRNNNLIWLIVEFRNLLRYKWHLSSWKLIMKMQNITSSQFKKYRQYKRFMFRW